MLNEQVWRNINCDVHARYKKTKLKMYSNVHVPVVMTDALSFFSCSARCRYNRKDSSSVCLLVVLAFSKIVLSGWKSPSEQ